MAFRENFAGLRQDQFTEVQVEPHAPAVYPVRIFCQDESRCGLLPVQRRRMTLSGGKPLGTGQYCFENFYVDGAVEPATGEGVFLELPQLNTINFQIFLDEFAHHDQDTLNVVLLDNGSCHTAKSLVIPDHVVCLFLPPYSPELNPIERRWQDLNHRLAWVLVAPLAAWERSVETLIKPYSTAAIQALTSSPYFVDAVHALCS